MSANTYWSPIGKGVSLDCLSGFLDVVAEARRQGRGGSELILSHDDIPRLDGIAAADPSTAKAVDEIIEAIHKHDTIRLWREY